MVYVLFGVTIVCNTLVRTEISIISYKQYIHCIQTVYVLLSVSVVCNTPVPRTYLYIYIYVYIHI